MKFVLLLLVVLAAVWLMRGAGRRRDAGNRPPPPPPARGEAVPDTMVTCAHCGVHLPRTEALPGPGGVVFCGEAHRAAGAKGAPR